MKNLSNWRSVRIWENRLQQDLHQRHAFWLHGLCIGLVTLGLTWGASHVQLLLGVESLALRYLVSLGLGYLGYLVMLRCWAGALVRKYRQPGQRSDWSNLGVDWPGGGGGGSVSAPVRMPAFHSAKGGDFGGGGASADFSGASDALASSDAAGGLGDIVGGAMDAAGSADEAAVVVVPVVAIFLIGCAVLLGAGSLVLMYLGWEALLAVAVELAFSYVSARVAMRVVREGWLGAALRLTYKPLLGAVVCAVVLGATIDHFVPEAHSLPQALHLIRAQSR